VSKEIVVRLRVPDWVDEDRMKKSIHKFTDELIESGEQTAEEARRFYGVTETHDRVEVPDGLEGEILEAKETSLVILDTGPVLDRARQGEGITEKVTIVSVIEWPRILEYSKF